MAIPTDPSSSARASAAPDEARTAAAGSWPRALLVVPLVAVSIFVAIGLGLVWWFHADYDLRALVQDLHSSRRSTWPKAYALSQLLRSPHQEALRHDASVCRELASVLDDHVRRAERGPADVRFRMFLCRALGEFRVPDGVASLLTAVEASDDAVNMPVRCAALEALAVLAGHIDPQLLAHDPRAVASLLAASRAADADDTTPMAIRAAATATFVLGILGGSASAHRLHDLLTHPQPDLRYNAATGLARHGHTDCIPVLREMLDLSQVAATHAGGPTLPADRAIVILNAARSARRLVAVNQHADIGPLVAVLDRVAGDASMSPELRRELQTTRAVLVGHTARTRQ